MAACLALVIVASGVASRIDSASPASWPGFRGPSASGVGDGPRPPDSWNVSTAKNIVWTTTVPGLAHSSPIVSGDRIFVTSAFIRGYDPDTGVERWRLGGSSKITAPTPVFADGIIVVASGRAPERPIFAIRPGGQGDISLRADQAANASIAWSKTGRGSYMPTPLIYQGLVYVLGNAGLFDAYDLKSGGEVFRQRIPHHGSGFSASPVAVDGRIYLPSEDGDVFVVRSGPAFELIATNSMGEPLMSTPALADGHMYVRGERHLFAVGQKR